MQFRENTACNLCHTPTREAKSLFAWLPPGLLRSHAAAWSSITASCGPQNVYSQEYYGGERTYEAGGYYDYGELESGLAKDYHFAYDFVMQAARPASNPYASSM